ncbi:MAG: hypothetical protein K6E68_08305 [Lachnospiraceae bacterium]|nr:hypothetical protein [Lachnospiraceae bacterium]
MISLDEIRKKADPGYRMTKDTVSFGHALDGDDVCEKFMESYSIYYNLIRKDEGESADDASDVDRVTVTEPFFAQAVFDSKGEQYFLIKAAKVAEVDSAEYVYFARVDELTPEALEPLDKKAWETGISHVNPSVSHKNTDVVLIVIADDITPEAVETVKRARHSKTYMFALHGYSNYRLVAIGLNKGEAYFNRQASILRQLVGNIITRDS